MSGFKVTVDPAEAPLEFVASEGNTSGFNLLAPLKKPLPQRKQQWTSNAETEGELSAAGKEDNVEIPIKLRIVGEDEEEFRAFQVQLEQKLHKLGGEGGVIRIEWPDGEWLDYEVRGYSGGDRLYDNRYVHSLRTEDELTFIVEPFGKGQEELLGEFSGSGRVVECVIDEVGGSAEALARAEIVSPAADLWELQWGRDSRYFEDEDPTSRCSYAAKELSPLGGATATTATVDGKAGVSVVRQGTLTPNWTAFLSFDVAGVGAMTHRGIFELYAWFHMPTSNSGEVAIGGEYGIGDLRNATPFEPVYFPANHSREGRVVRLSFGHLWLRPQSRGTHQWTGRLLAMSTVVGDDLDVLDVGLRPVEELNGQVSAVPSLRQPSALLTRDEFNQPGGNLNGKIIAAAASKSGPKNPATAVEDSSSGSRKWLNVGNATGLPNGTYAEAEKNGTLGGPGISTSILKATNPTFSIPLTATINGIEVSMLRKSSQGFNFDAQINAFHYWTYIDEWMRLVKAGAYVGESKKQSGEWPTSPAWAIYGGPQDLWGTTWTPAQVNASNFGTAFKGSPRFFSNEDAGRPIGYIDAFQITVYYTDAAGQEWATTGDANDITVDEAADNAQRNAVSDASLTEGRYAVAGTTVTTDVVVGLQVKRSGVGGPGSTERVRLGALARYVDTSNWLFFGLDAFYPASPLEESLRVFKRVAGGEPVELGKLALPTQFGIARSLYLHVDSRGRWFAWGALQEGGIPRLLMAGQDNDLAAGAALDDGKTGFYDVKTGSNSCTRYYDNLVAWIPTLEAVAFEGRKLELTHDAVEREAPEGGRYTPLTPEVDYLKLAPSGMENRKNRLVFIASPHDPDLMGVGFPTELKVALYATKRYRGVPDPA